jgi:magnesium chelatase subunit D
LRAAAPWQPLRRREQRPSADGLRIDDGRRVLVRKSDVRVTRYKQPCETCVVFSVDASGSSALQRLNEAKGAVERVLADCYARRDQVALVAFRGTQAAIVLPPTRSLSRLRRRLTDLAGGGPTPIAAGIDTALGVALDARKRGATPIVVIMTDGRANIARDGTAGGGRALDDALASARRVRSAGVVALFLDTSPRPRPQARALSDAMAARYMHLPYADAARISSEVQSVAKTAAP